MGWLHAGHRRRASDTRVPPRLQASVLAAIATLGHAAARPALAGAVFAAQDAGADCASVVAAALQHHRESEARPHDPLP
jgi:hypothetical protein